MVKPVGGESRPFRGDYAGMACIVWARSAGAARTAVVRSARDAGYPASYPEVVVHRAREFDHVATAEVGKCYCLDHIPT